MTSSVRRRVTCQNRDTISLSEKLVRNDCPKPSRSAGDHN